MGAKVSRNRAESEVNINGISCSDLGHPGSKAGVLRRRREAAVRDRHSNITELSWNREQLSPLSDRPDWSFSELNLEQAGLTWDRAEVRVSQTGMGWESAAGTGSPERTGLNWNHSDGSVQQTGLQANGTAPVAAAVRMDCMRGGGGRNHLRPLSDSDRGVYVIAAIFTCPFCMESVPVAEVRSHLTTCLNPPHLSYNVDTLSKDSGECTVCLEDLKEGDRIARLPCLCVYHKSCIDSWSQVKASCPQHPFD